MDTQSRNLTIPRGKIFFAKYLTGTQTPGPLRELGNCPEFTLTINSETLPHYSSQAGLRTLDEEVTLDSTLDGSVVTDDIKAENVALFFLGEVSTKSQTALTGEDETFGNVKAGDSYQLGRSDANPSGHRKVSNVVVTKAPSTTLVAGTDYEVDLDLGIITFLVANTGVSIAYDVAASSREQIVAGTKQIEGEMKFISMNPVGAQADITLPRARITPNGDFTLVNDPESTAFQQMPLSIRALKKGTLALAYRDGRAVTA